MVANDPNTGEILAIASYPTFDLTTYNADYLDLYANPAQPLYNRALQGLYAPGSTFKMGMVVAGIIIGPYVLNWLSEDVLAISSQLRKIALIIILLRAGLKLTLEDLKTAGRPAILM